MSPNWKIERIKALNDEVGEFQPVLQSLFRKIPNVTHVERHQGNREMGADFVLTRRDPAIFLDDYIGVIVKTTPIKQDQEDVRRQIRECGYGRPYEGGKKTINISEIWVVTSKNITKSAQEVIANEYQTSKIRFFDADKIAQLIDAHNPEYWDFENAKFSVYINAQRTLIDNHAKLHSLLPVQLSHVAIEQQVQKLAEKKKHKFKNSKTKPSRLIDEIKKKNFLFIQGQMGAGKSELLRSTALQMCKEDCVKDLGTIPHFLTVRELFEGEFSLIEKTHEIHAALGDSETTVVYFLDGLDEAPQDIKDKIEKVCALAKSSAENSKIKLVVSSREIQDTLLDQKISEIYDQYQVCPLTYGGVIQFIAKICEGLTISPKFKDDLQRSPLVRALPRTPLSAILLGKLISEKVKELPSTLPELYAKYTELVLGRWDMNKGNGSEKEYETIYRITSQLAAYMFENKLDVIGLPELRAMFSDYLRQRKTGQDEDKLFRTFLEKQEIISIDQENALVQFRHRTFQEFFSAVLLFQQKGKEAPIEDPFNVEGDAREYFYLGLIRDAPERIEKLRRLVATEDIERVVKITTMGRLLMAAYQTPYDEIIKAVNECFLDAARLYSSIIQEKKERWLRKLPELQLLALFNALVRSSYSYEYFAEALKESKLLTEVDDSIPSDVKVVNLFLLDSVLAELGDSTAFERLVEKYETNLPWAVKLGINIAAKEASVMNDATKAMGKRIIKSIKQNSNLPAYFEDLESKPIDDRFPTVPKKK